MPKRDALVKFVIAGMQKAGTTALHEYLCSHPQLCMSSPKEIHFFDNELSVDWTSPDYSFYESHFPGNRKGQICGEATPIYSFWPNSLQRMQAYNPDMKLIIMLRNRCERAYSHWAMEVSRGSEVLSFSEAIRDGRQRYNLQDLTASANRVVSYVERGFYAPQLSRAQAYFGKKNLLVIENKSLSEHPDVTLQGVCEFLGVDSFPSAIDPIFVRPVQILPDLIFATETDLNYLTNSYKDDVVAIEGLKLQVI
jgi:hypothetical protein